MRTKAGLLKRTLAESNSFDLIGCRIPGGFTRLGDELPSNAHRCEGLG